LLKNIFINILIKIPFSVILKEFQHIRVGGGSPILNKADYQSPVKWVPLKTACVSFLGSNPRSANGFFKKFLKNPIFKVINIKSFIFIKILSNYRYLYIKDA
jgi:hypothetical protein